VRYICALSLSLSHTCTCTQSSNIFTGKQEDVCDNLTLKAFRFQKRVEISVAGLNLGSQKYISCINKFLSACANLYRPTQTTNKESIIEVPIMHT